jgi:hypothetical protein
MREAHEEKDSVNEVNKTEEKAKFYRGSRSLKTSLFKY